MELIQTKIIQKSLQKLIYIPNMLKFQFPEFKNLPPLQKLNFLQKKNLLSYNYHKLIPFEDLKSIFTTINKKIYQEISQNTNECSKDIFNALNQFRKFLADLAEDKHFLNFDEFENLLLLLEKSSNFEFIYLILQVFLNIFSIRTRYCEELLLNVSDFVKNKFFMFLNCWFLNVNLGNEKSFKIHELIECEDIQGFLFFDLSSFDDVFFGEVNEDFFKTENIVRDIHVENKIILDLKNYLEFRNHSLVLEQIFKDTNKKIHEKSFLSHILKMRILIIKNIYNFETKKFNNENILYLTFCAMSSNLIINHTKKVKDLKERQIINKNILNFKFYEEHKKIPIKNFLKIFKKSKTEKNQIETLQILYSHYESLEIKKDSYLDFENFLRKILINLNNCLLLKKGIFETIQEKENFQIINSDKIIHQVIIITWRFFEEEIEGASNSSKYSQMIDIILNIATTTSESLEKSYNPLKIINLLKIIVMLKNEIQKDKEIVFLPILIKMFNKHITLYNDNYSKITNYPNVLNLYTQLLFELIEALFFYFIDPAKPNLVHSIPRISREILENEIWANKSIVVLIKEKKDQGFLQVFNVIISFLNDLFIEVPENFVSGLLDKFFKIGFVRLIHEEFLMNNIPSDFDLLSFYVKFLSLIFLHKKEFLGKGDMRKYLTRVFDVIFYKEMVSKNIRRFLSAYVNETLKNLGEEIVMFCNSVPQVNDFILEKIYEMEKKITDIEDYVVKGITESMNHQELIHYFMNNPHFIKDIGWFNYDENSTTADFYDDFYLLQKNIHNIWKLYTKFFDHHRTDFYKKFFESEISKKNKSIFDFIFKRKIIFFSEISKNRKLHTTFVKSLIQKNNNFTKKKIIPYLQVELIKTSKQIQKFHSQSSKKELQHTSYLLNKFNFQNSKQEFDLDLSKLTNNTYNLINLYISILSIADCIKYQISSNMEDSISNYFSNSVHFFEFIKYYKSVNDLCTELFMNSEDFFWDSLYLKMDSILAENFILNLRVSNHVNMSNIFLTIQNNCVLNLLSINKELFYLIFTKIKKEDRIKFYNVFFQSHDNMGKIDAVLEKKKDDFGIVHLNSLFNQYVNIIVNDATHFKDFINSGIYSLSKRQFFSKTLINSMKFVITYINDRTKKIRKLLLKKENPDSFINISEISQIYLFDETITVLLKNFIKLLNRLFFDTTLTKIINQEEKSISLFEAKNIIEIERLETINNLSILFQNFPKEGVLTLSFLEKKLNTNYLKRSSKKSLKEIQKEMGLKVNKMNILKAFLESYKTFYDNLILFFIPSNFKVKLEMNFDELSEEKKIEFKKTAKEMGFGEEIIGKALKNHTVGSNINDFLGTIFESNHEKTENFLVNKEIGFEKVQKKNLGIRKQGDIMQKKLNENLGIMVKFFFNNFLKFKEIYKTLVLFFVKFAKYENDLKKNFSYKFLNELIESSLSAIKKLSGIKEKNNDTNSQNYIIELKNPQNALYYLLKLLNDLKKHEKKDIKEEKKKQKKNDLNFLLNLLEDIFTKKYKLKRVQDPIYAIMDLLLTIDLFNHSKIQILTILDKMIYQHKLILKNKPKEKFYLINPKILKRIFELLSKLINHDEKFIEIMINFKEKNFIKNLIRLEIKDVEKNTIKELNANLRNFVEKIVRQPQIIQILFESEIKNYFFKNSEKIYLKTFSKTFENFIENCENIFMFVTKKICNIEKIKSLKKQEDSHIITLKKDQTQFMKNYEVKQFINDFVFILIKDLILKLNRRSKNLENNYVFNDVIMSDIIFLQLMPRYPMFYLIKTKEKIPFTKFLFEKIINLHWGYLNFFEPLIYDSHFLVENENKEILNVNEFLQEQINNSVLGILEGVKKDILVKKINVFKLMNVNLYILNLSKFGNFIEKFKKFFIEVLEKVEEIAILINEKDLIPKEYELAILGISETLRKLQIIKLMHKQTISDLSKKNNSSTYLTIPKTFTYSLKKWIFQRDKLNQDHSFSLKTKTNIDYTNFSSQYLLNDEIKKPKDKIRIFFQNEINDIPNTYRDRILNINPNNLHNFANNPNVGEIQQIRESEENSESEEESVENISNPDDQQFMQTPNFQNNPELINPPGLEIMGNIINEEENIINEENENFENFQEPMEYMEIEELDDDLQNVNYGDHVIEEEHFSSSGNDNLAEEEEFVEVEEYDQNEDLEDYEDASHSSENLTISHHSTVFQSQNYLVHIKDEFFSKTLFEKYPYAFPLNLRSVKFLLFDDQINYGYQYFITNEFLKFFRKKNESFYLKCHEDFENFDYKQWDSKYINELKKKPDETWGNRMVRHRRRINEGGSFIQYFDIINRRNNRNFFRGDNEDRINNDEEKNKFNLYEELKNSDENKKEEKKNVNEEEKIIEEYLLKENDKKNQENKLEEENQIENPNQTENLNTTENPNPTENPNQLENNNNPQNNNVEINLENNTDVIQNMLNSLHNQMELLDNQFNANPNNNNNLNQLNQINLTNIQNILQDSVGLLFNNNPNNNLVNQNLQNNNEIEGVNLNFVNNTNNNNNLENPDQVENQNQMIVEDSSEREENQNLQNVEENKNIINNENNNLIEEEISNNNENPNQNNNENTNQNNNEDTNQNNNEDTNQNNNMIVESPENIINNSENNSQIQEFDFSTLGLPDNFLEIAEIDPTFFYALPSELQAELAIQHGEALNIRRQPQPQNPTPDLNQAPIPQTNPLLPPENPSNPQNLQNNLIETANNNMIFLSSLAPDIREDVLLTCPDEFLLSLTPDIQDEARRIRTARIINQDFYVNNQIRNQQIGNTVENRLKKSLEGNKQKDLINKIYPVEIYKCDRRIMGVFKCIEDLEFNLNNVPIGLISALMFDDDLQNLFYENIFLSTNLEVKKRYLFVTEKLTYSNYQFFHKKVNFDRLLEYLLEFQHETFIITIILKILIHVTQTSVSFLKKKANCGILISKRNLQCLTCTNYIKTSNFPVSEYLSRILMILSFNKENLKTIIDNLKDNISTFGFNLNLNLENILKIKKQNNYIDKIKKIASNNFDSYVKFLKLFKLVEQLFTKSFNINLQDVKKNNSDKKKEIEDDKFEKIKEKVLNEFSNYFDDSTIKNVFAKLFKIIFIFEKDIDELLKIKTFSKPVFFQFLPLIEAFFISYKILCDDETFQNIKKKYKFKNKKKIQISKYKDRIESEEDSQSEKEFILKSEDLEIENIFYQACRKNKKVLNYMMTKIPRLADSSLKIIIKKAPKIITFDLKRKYFNQKITEQKINHTLRLKIRRSNLFTDSFTQIISKNPVDLRMKLHIKFVEEEGEDAGGLTRAWFQKLSMEIFNPNYVLFKPAAHGYAFQPNPNSNVHLEHLKYFKFIGRIVGKALFEGQLLDAHFTSSFYKHMVGEDLSYLDFQDYDPAYFQTLKWILENDVGLLDLDFSYETDHFGKTISKPLKTNGTNIQVTNANKEEYIKLLCYAKMADEIKPQIEAFLEGLNDVVPAELIKIFTSKELELMISGLPEIDIEDLRKNTLYTNYTKDSLVIKNFWKVLKEFDQNLIAGFLQFVTGTSKVPLEGFRTLKGMGGEIQKFQIHRAYEKNKLPTSHTCMNQLDLPEYESLEDLRKMLKTAIIYGKEGFGFL